LLEGKTLRAVINEADNGLPSADAVPMIHGMAKALAYAHDNGIVHSDFKPSNVFFTRKEQIKVLDFGVARVAPTRAEPGSDTDWDPDPIEVREVGGLTPAYASPEMLQGLDPAPADDVFALAIVCYELLTGRHPFNRRPVDPQVLGDVRAKSLHGLSWSQRKALARAFSPERENRHENAGEFLKEFAGPSKTRTIAQAGVAASAALALFAVLYLPTVEPVPSVEFDELPAEVQQEFNTAVREGQRALSFGDAGINEAFFYYSLAYELHPNNQVAVIGLETVADRFLSSIRAADADTQRDVLDLLYCQDYLRSYAPVASACDDLFGPQCEAIARGCSVTRTGN
jgi:serine/threonine protein kinase